VNNISFGPGKYKMIEFAGPNNLDRAFQIDPMDIAVSAVTVKFGGEDVCESGILKNDIPSRVNRILPNEIKNHG
jgi:hypothetical protein